MNPPSRSRIVSIEEVAAYLIDQNMVHTRGAPGAAKRQLLVSWQATLVSHAFLPQFDMCTSAPYERRRHRI